MAILCSHLPSSAMALKTSKWGSEFRPHMQATNKIRINEIKYEIQELRVEWAKDEYIELLVIEGGFDPSYWYVTNGGNDNFWEIPSSCPLVSSNDIIVIHLGVGVNDNDGPVFHFYMNEIAEQLTNHGDSISLFEDNDSLHNLSEDTAHDFVAFGITTEDKIDLKRSWGNWPNNGKIVTETIKWELNRHESLQLIGNDLDNSDNWFPAKITPGRSNKLINCYNEDLYGLDSEIYCNKTATNASGWGHGRIQPPLNMSEKPLYEGIDELGLDVFVSGDYAYVACGSAGLAIINISNPTNPGTPTYATSVAATGVHINGDYAYVACLSAGLAIINISDPNNPGAPIYRDTIGDAHDVFISGEFAYIANGFSGLAIINISDPNNPGTPIYRDTTGDAYIVYIGRNYAYLACLFSGLVIIDISDPTNPGEPIYQETNGVTYSVCIGGDFAYVACGTAGLAIIDISDPINPGIPMYRNTVGRATDVFVNDYFAGTTSAEGLTLIDSSNPLNSGERISRSTPSSARSVFIKENYLFVSCSRHILVIFELPEMIGFVVAQSVCCYRSTGDIHNVTLSVNQTVFPNSCIYYQVSTNSIRWELINPNEIYSLTDKHSSILYWRARLEVEDLRGPTPGIDSILLDLDIFYDTKSSLEEVSTTSVIIYPSSKTKSTIGFTPFVILTSFLAIFLMKRRINKLRKIPN
ncbi:MAG: hypothetical protein JSW11_18665 [Candidatus Heimdallarchaeota archaeon]|nr:MAG: hypothetical protein JSW11_18665 [Candidatus Heimdallarchaeota archaeon]